MPALDHQSSTQQGKGEEEMGQGKPIPGGKWKGKGAVSTKSINSGFES